MQQGNQQQNSSALIQGRIVWTSGNLFAGKPMTDDNNRPVLDENGQQCISYGFGLAVPKTLSNGAPNPQVNEIWAIMQREALTVFPNGNFPNDFAWKYKDGDGNDHNGQPFANREGYKNCLVFACTTQIPIKYFKWEGNTNILINDGIKCGDYVNVQMNVKGHPAKGRGKAGLYLNPTACQLIAAGKEIINAPSGDQVFGMGAPVYTVGNVEAPTAPIMPQGNMGGMPAPGGMPMNQGMPAPQQQQYAPQNMPAPQQQQYAPQQQQAPEHYGVLPGQFQQQAPAPQQQQYAPQGMPAPQQQQYAPQTGMPGQGMPQPQQQQYAPQQGGMPGMPGMPR